MTQDEIIDMARQAGIIFGYPAYHDRIEIFAKLVAAKEREQIIAITTLQEFSRMYGEFTPSAYDLVKAIRARGEA